MTIVDKTIAVWTTNLKEITESVKNLSRSGRSFRGAEADSAIRAKVGALQTQLKVLANEVNGVLAANGVRTGVSFR